MLHLNNGLSCRCPCTCGAAHGALITGELCDICKPKVEPEAEPITSDEVEIKVLKTIIQMQEKHITQLNITVANLINIIKSK